MNTTIKFVVCVQVLNVCIIIFMFQINAPIGHYIAALFKVDIGLFYFFTDYYLEDLEIFLEDIRLLIELFYYWWHCL
jgi:hypothetical protein